MMVDPAAMVPVRVTTPCHAVFLCKGLCVLLITAVDGTFCQAALSGKIQIKEQLPKYFGGSIQLGKPLLLSS